VILPWTTTPNARGTDNIINRGWADLQNSESLSKSDPLVPGRYYEIIFDLEPDDQIIPAGKQIGLMIFSSDREFTLWPDPGTRLTVDLNGTSIKIPIVGGRKVLQ
jgi:X-Pro dipeptidyl-peptidase